MEGAIGGLRGVGGLRGGGGGACACESAKRHAKAACGSADIPSGMQMRRGHADAKGACWEAVEARTFKPPKTCDRGFPTIGVLYGSFFLSRKKRKFRKVSWNESFESFKVLKF
jgi:hypothetical protein